MSEAATAEGSGTLHIPIVQHELASSSIKTRTDRLQSVSESLSRLDVERDDALSLLILLLDTHTHYQDRLSRAYVRKCFLSLLLNDPDQRALRLMVNYIRHESQRPVIAASSAFVLVEWCSLLLQHLSHVESWSDSGTDIILAHALLLEKCMQRGARKSITHSALVVTRRGLRHFFGNSECRGNRLHDAVTALISKGAGTIIKHAPLLGAIAGTAARLSSTRALLPKLKSDYFSFYVSEYVNSKATIEGHLAHAMRDFFSDFVTQIDLERELVSPIQKGLLRSPEVVLDGVLRPLLVDLPNTLDVSCILRDSWLKPILSNAKSSNATVRLAALSVIRAGAAKSRDQAALDAVAKEVSAPLQAGRLTSPDQRILHAQMLECIPLSIQGMEQVTTILAMVASKEGNEAALCAETRSLAEHAIRLSENQVYLPKAVLESLLRGIKDKKPSIRRCWILLAADLLLSSEADHLNPVLEPAADAIIPKLVDIFQEVLVNPPAAAQSGLVVGAYVLVALSGVRNSLGATSPAARTIKGAAVLNQAIDLDTKQPFLLGQKTYNKIAAEDDIGWFCRALSRVGQSLTEQSNANVVAAWSQAVIYVSSSRNSPIATSRQASKFLQKIYAIAPSQIGQIMLTGLWNAILASEGEEKDRELGIDRSNLPFVLKAICLGEEDQERLDCRIPKEVAEMQACAMLVLARPRLLPQVNWIDLCLRMGCDPADLVHKYGATLFLEISKRTSMGQIEIVKEAAHDAAAELAFVAPDLAIPELMRRMCHDLDAEAVKTISPMDVAICRTEPDICFVDVLAKKKQGFVPNKNTKDYEILKWEAELRSQLEEKRGERRRLTAEENAKVSDQLAKEAKIRASVHLVAARLRCGIGNVVSLVNGPPTDASLWLGTATKLLLDIMDAGAGVIVGDAASQAYLACSKAMVARLGLVRASLGIATLRLRDITVAESFRQEPLGEHITRILYRLRFASEQRPLDPVSFTYALPLLLDILHRGGVAKDADDRDAQVVLAIEFLASHTDVCADDSVPRVAILAAIIDSMQRYAQHHKLIRDCFFDLCRCIAPNIVPSELAVLERAAINPQTSVRYAVLQAMSAEIDMSGTGFSDELWIACHDDENEVRDVAGDIWAETGAQIEVGVSARMVTFTRSKDIQLRRAAARSLAVAEDYVHAQTLEAVLQTLRASYTQLAQPIVQQLDEFGMPRKMDLSDPWEARHGIGLTFKETAKLMNAGQLAGFFDFLIEHGPLGDNNDTVRAEMLEAAGRAIDLHGGQMVAELMLRFESTLERPDNESEKSDRVNEAVVIMYGALARHLQYGSSKIPVVIERLLSTLETPSETVQFAIAQCLQPLIRSYPEKAGHYIDQVLAHMLVTETYASRRGAAYGLAGLVSGRGIFVLREHRVLSALKTAVANKKETHQREAGLIAFELLSSILGRLFEPYIIQIVPQLLGGFGDSNPDVREACLAAAKACFGKLSSFGLMKIMPVLLEGLEDDQWRSKRGACDLLGAMAYLDPEQLAHSLPEIIPPLTSVLNDSHKEVRTAANRSLKRFGEVITNPEIQSLVDVLLKALSDPTKYTDESLDALIKVQFVHYLDAPSLALVTRVLQRGLSDRSNTKRKAAQVIGSLAHLTERKDILTHLPILVAGLKIAAVDPVPTTRATASRALGSLVEKLGEEALPDLIPGLMQTLKSDTGAGDRLGSAQALSEVLAGLGTTRLEETLPTILQNVDSAKPAVREGFMSLFIFLPVCFGNSFATYLGKIIPPILSGLADDIESIRDTALRAGRLLVKNFAVRAVDLLLPELERGLADDNYRIRLSSVELVGDLLFNLTGIKAATEEEVEELTQETSVSLKEVLGEDKRNRILSALYICRCDTAGAVRSAAVSIWKVLVHSPRTLKELVPTFTTLLVRRLGTSNMEHKVIASNALGELIRKAGDGVLATLLPTLEQSLETSSDSDAKQGICLALRELISSATPDALEEHEKILISVVRRALTDADVEVREVAAEAFDSLQQVLGKRAVGEVLPFLLTLLGSEEEADNALSALLTLLTDTTRSNMILPNLIPTLTNPPISAFDAKALASLSKVAGAAMNRRLPSIVNSLLENEISCQDATLREDLASSFDIVVQSIDEYDGLNTIMNVLLGLLQNEDHRKRTATASHLRNFFASASVDYSRYNQDVIRALLTSFDDGDLEVVTAAWAALNEFTKKLRKEEMESLVVSTKQTLQRVGVQGSNLRGFELPKGINAVLPIFLQGLMNGTAEQRVHAAMGISDIVSRASESSLKPFVTQITGPLIRVVSERATEVKSAILLTLNNLLEKMPAALKPFLPQLQRTFAKSLADPSSEQLRGRAAKALGTLIKHTPRIDPLIAELVTGSRTSDVGVKTAMLKALYEVVSKAGVNMGELSRSTVLALIDTDTDESNIKMLITNARLLGALMQNVSGEAALAMLRNRVFKTQSSVSSVLALNATLVEAPTVIAKSPLFDDLPDLLCHGMKNKNTFIADNYILATGKVLMSIPPKSFDNCKKIIDTLADVIAPNNASDSRRLALVIVRTLSRRNMDLVRPHIYTLTLPTFASVRDPVIPIKLSAEAAFIELFSVAGEESRIFDKFMEGPGSELPPMTKRSMGDYFKRVATRLGAQARDRREAEGGQGGLGLSNDEIEDEREIWSIGKVEVEVEGFGT